MRCTLLVYIAKKSSQKPYAVVHQWDGGRLFRCCIGSESSDVDKFYAGIACGREEDNGEIRMSIPSSRTIFTPEGIKSNE